MQTKNQISLTRKTLYLIMLLGLFLSAFGEWDLPTISAEKNLAKDQSIGILYEWSPIANVILYWSLNSENGGPGLRPYDLNLYNAQSDKHYILASDGNAGSAKFSKDGSTISFWYDNMPYITSMEGETVSTNRVETLYTPIKSAFSSNNEYLIYTTHLNEVRMRDLTTDQETNLGYYKNISSLPFLSPEWSPNDQWVAFGTETNAILIDPSGLNNSVIISDLILPQSEFSSATHFFVWSTNSNTLYDYKYNLIYTFASEAEPAPALDLEGLSFDSAFEISSLDGELFLQQTASGAKKQLTSNNNVIEQIIELSTQAQSNNDVTAQAVADGFDFPICKPNLDGCKLDGSFDSSHPGQDMNGSCAGGGNCDFDWPVYAVANGVVVYSDWAPGTSWGNIIMIEHTLPDGTKRWSQYAHLNRRDVVSGEVTRGQQIGTIGQGYANQFLAHLHFEIRIQNINAYAWITDPNTYLNYYTNPVDFINSHRTIGGGTNNCQNTGGSGIRLYDGTLCTGTEKYFSSTGFTNMPDVSFNDAASSINVGDGWSARVYEHDNRGGSSRCINGDMWDLYQDYYTSGDTGRRIDNDISSMEVFNNSSCTGGSPPNTPSNLRNNSSTQTSITIAWDDTSNETGYKIYKWNGATATFDYFSSIGANVTSFTETRSNCGWDEYYTVSAYNSYGESSQSGWVHSLTQSCPVTLPNAPTLSNPSSGQYFNEGESITLSWSATGSEYYGEVWGGPGGTLTFGWQSGTSNNIGSQWAGYTYSWRVKTRNSAGESGWSETRTFVVRPGAPSNLSATAVSCSQINLSWSDNSGNEEGYKVYRNSVLIATLGSGVTSYPNTGLSGSTNYSYTVKAYRGSIESNASNTASATTQSCPAGPTTPAIISPAQATVLVYPQNVAFDWSDSGDTYTFYFPGGPSATQYNTTASSTTVNAPLAGFYEWFVVAHRNGQDSGPSAYTDLYIVPSAPQSVNTTTNSSSAVTINWTTSLGGVDEYKIYRNSVYVATVNATTYSFQVTNLPCGNTSTYSVRAYKGLGSHNESPERTAVGSTSSCLNGSGDAYEPDNSSGSAQWIYSGIPQPHSIVPATDEDWVKFTLSSQSAVLLETNGTTSSDTRMWLYNSSLGEVESSDDEGIGLYSFIDRLCGTDPLPAGTYYVKVDDYGNNHEISAYSISLNSKACPSTSVNVSIAAERQGSYLLAPSGSQRVNYLGVDSGPVVVESLSGNEIIAAMRDAYFVGGQLESFVQMMGLPQESLSTKYYFPAYNNVTLDGQLRFGNVGNSATTVTVTIGGVVRGTYPLNPGEAKRVNYTGLDSGPVVVESSGGVPIIAALRDAYYVNGRLESFAQLMGLPAEKLSTKYYFPAYNNVTLDGQLRVGNVGNSATTVTVTIAGVVRGTYPLNPSQAVRINYPSLDSGPVVVESSGGVPIIAALRDAYFVSGKLVSFVQLMGLPAEQLSTNYNFPAYNNVTLDGQLRFGNIGNSATTVTVTIGGVVRGTYPLNPSEAKRVNYVGLDAGPVVIQSSGGVPIIAALRDAYFVNGVIESFAQMMGLPLEQLSSAYYFPAYNNVTLDEQLRFGVP